MRSLVVALPYLLSTINVRILSIQTLLESVHCQSSRVLSSKVSLGGCFCLEGFFTDLSIGLLQYAQVSQSVKIWR